MPGTQQVLNNCMQRCVCVCVGQRAKGAHGLDSAARSQLLSSLHPPGVNLQPQLASVTFATNNPTLTTVALEKPLCMFDSTAALDGPHQVYLYVLVASGEVPLPRGYAERGFDLSAGRREGGR